jgi:hypothetical protein
MLEVLERAILAAVKHKWVLDYVVPLGQLAVLLVWKRAARRFHWSAETMSCDDAG